MEEPFYEKFVYKSHYKSMVQAFMRTEHGEVFGIGCSEEKPKSFVRFVQIFFDKIARTLNFKALVANPVHAV